jgi:hypothetical protein
MAHLLPYARFSIRTQLPVPEATRLLANHISVRQNWIKRLWMRSGGFEGVVHHSRFNINPVPVGRNSFLPYLYGRIEPTPDGSVLHVLTTLHPVSGAITLAIAAGLVFLVVNSFVEFTHNQSAADKFYVFLGLTIFFYGLVMLSFWPTARAAQRFISELYQDSQADMSTGLESRRP